MRAADWLLDGPAAPILIIAAVLLAGAAILAPIVASILALS